MTPADVLKLIKEKEAKFADLRFTDTIGKEQHVTVPTRLVDEGFFKDGKMFDGSSIAGWKGINESDMILMPDPATAVIDPFYEVTTVNLRCVVIEPRPIQGYFPVPSVDSQQDIRSAMAMACEQLGLKFEVHHHEVATAGQGEINVAANTLTKKADEVQILKYALQNVAHAQGKTLTFMPKPIVGDNGNGMHVHQSLQKEGKALFAGDKYGGLSDIALYYIGGIIKHARAINAFTNASTNSYKRLVPGFEAPVKLAYSARNRSASIRIPWISNPKGRRIEVRFPDATANPYFAFSSMLLAGLDGIRNKIHPGDPADKDLYDLEPEEDKKIPTVCHSLEMALDYLDKDRGFLKAGEVFTDDLIDAYIELKMKEVTRLRMTTHPIEVEMYYSL